MSSSRTTLLWTALLAVAACWAAVVCAVEPGTLLAIYPDPSNPAANNYSFSVVTAVTVGSDGTIYVADAETADNGGTGRVVILSSEGVLRAVLPDPSNPATSGYSFNFVGGLAVTSAGTLYVSDTDGIDNGGDGRVVVLSSTGELVSMFPDPSKAAISNYNFTRVFDIALDSHGNVYVADSATPDNGGIGRVVKLSSEGELLAVYPDVSNPVTSGYNFTDVGGVFVDSAGNILVADDMTADNGGFGRVVVLSPAGELLNTFPDVSNPLTSNYNFTAALDVRVDRQGNIYVSDQLQQSFSNGGIGRVVVLSPAGELLYMFPDPSNPATSSYSFHVVDFLGLDSAGNIYVADEGTADNNGAGRVVVLASVIQPRSSSSSSSSTGSSALTSSSAPSVQGDPVFVGFHGQRFVVKGLAGRAYNVLSLPTLQLNTRFVALSTGSALNASAQSLARTRQSRLISLLTGQKAGSAGTVDTLPSTTSWSHDGLYIGETGVQVDGHRLLVQPGAYVDGFEAVELDGVAVQVSSEAVQLSAGSHIRRYSSSVLHITTPDVSFTLVNSDHFLNIHSAELTTPRHTAQHIHGLLGQTADEHWTVEHTAAFKQHLEADFVLPEPHTVWSTSFPHNRYVPRDTHTAQ